MEIFLRSFISGCRNARQGLLIKKTAVILRPFLTQTAISLRWHCLKICFLFLLGVQILWEDGGKYSEISNVLHGEHYSENSFGEIRGGDQLWLKEIRKVLCYVQTTPLNFFLSFFNIAIVGSNSARWNYAIIQHDWEASKIAGNNTGIYNFLLQVLYIWMLNIWKIYLSGKSTNFLSILASANGANSQPNRIWAEQHTGALSTSFDSTKWSTERC